MKRHFTLISCILGVLFLAPLMLVAQPIINQISPLNTTVGQYEKFEVAIDLNASYSNPYDYDQITVKAVFTGPDNQPIDVDGFYIEDYILSTSGGLTPDGDGFKLRFAPHLIGSWSYALSVTDANGTTTHPTQTFDCVNASAPFERGFARLSNSNYLQTDNQEQLILIGENMCWQNNNAFQDYKKWIDKMTANGGNYFRLWHAHWGLGIEWENGWNQFEGLRKYHQVKSRYQDWLYEYCSENDVYIMLALQHHGPVSTQVNPNWNDSPYNVANGGPCQNTAEFFTNQIAIDHTKNRYRYIVARWGYSRAIMSWELFNEVEWTDNYDQIRSDVALWHADMAQYIKSIDPYQHLITTSFAKSENDPLIWGNTDFDFTQTHYYLNSPNIERVLGGGIKSYLDEYGKPTMNGEFGIGLSSTLPQVDPDGIHIHNGLWGTLFSGAMGTGMTWWWDIYVEVSDLYYHFDAVAKVTADIPLKDKQFTPANGVVSGAPGDLSLIPSLDWGSIGTDTITVNNDGSISPTNASLGTFLYGSQWNTQFRSPPVFVVNYPQDGTFTISTGSGTGNSPKLNVRLDGSQVLSQNAQVSTDYLINVPAGAHIIKVDNTGTDWISIGAYSFSGLGSKVDAYVMQSQDNKMATGWLLSNQYNHSSVPQGGPPTPVTGTSLHLENLVDSTYFLKWYNCLTGAVIASDPVTVVNGELDATIPAFQWDLAFLLDRNDAPITALEVLAEANFKLYPNPAQAGATLTLEIAGLENEGGNIQLLDMSGRQLWQKEVQFALEQQFELPANLTQGLYWVKIQAGEQVGTKPIVVSP
ncbi:MAG: DUF5060 domain-containing protein [Bacteroidia bacterium]